MINIITQEDLDEMIKVINQMGEDVKQLRSDFETLVEELNQTTKGDATEDEPADEEPEEAPVIKKKGKPKLRV